MTRVQLPKPERQTADGHLNRRELIKLSTFGCVGLSSGMLAPSLAATPMTVIGYVAQFAAAIGAQVIADTIGRYLYDAPARQRVAVGSANSRMVSGGFSDFSKSHVFAIDDHIFYAAINTDGFNSCVAFINNHSQDDNVNLSAMTEGPTVVGLALAATSLARNRPPMAVRNILHPEGVVKESAGSFQAGYSRPDVFKTIDGVVHVNYTNTGRGKGTIDVVAARPIDKAKMETIFGESFDIDYA